MNCGDIDKISKNSLNEWSNLLINNYVLNDEDISFISGGSENYKNLNNNIKSNNIDTNKKDSKEKVFDNKNIDTINIDQTKENIIKKINFNKNEEIKENLIINNNDDTIIFDSREFKAEKRNNKYVKKNKIKLKELFINVFIQEKMNIYNLNFQSIVFVIHI